ncbi:MAG: NAD(P)-dependent glycerol-3-phosphate dehydrogenase [Hydrogenophilales bacterium]|nr:NAD(P)-dependent glycerol-3-phosphate dehydrogenase [Hydrogenophilales bacterium]
MKTTVLGAGAWGTALAISLSEHHAITLWARDPRQIDTIACARENARYLPGFSLPDSIALSADLGQAIDGAEFILAVVPTSGFRALLTALTQAGNTAPIVWACKGFEPGGAKLLHQVAAETLHADVPRGVLSGPSFAQEVALGLPCALTLASGDAAFAQEMAARFNNHHLRVYSSTDVVGVELGGAVKNVMAIAAGISDGMSFGLNARAALITRGLAEITRLGLALGGRLETFMGLTGVGDLILTCTGDLSRNRTVGLRLAQGQALKAILEQLGHTAEGVHTCAEVLRMAEHVKVEMPIAREVYRVMFEGLPPRQALEDLLAREPKPEYRS